jgi:hypothetical protein
MDFSTVSALKVSNFGEFGVLNFWILDAQCIIEVLVEICK